MSTMSEGRTISDTTRRSLLAGLMMAMLTGSVGVAWWLSASRQVDPRAAREILAGIRQRGLPALWGDEPVANWYIRYRTDGRPVGWHVTNRLRLQDGGYAGRRIEQNGDLFSTQTWALDDDARSGKYESRRWRVRTVSLPGRVVRMPVPLGTTAISFSNGQVSVAVAEANLEIKAPLPDDYIPNGLADLATCETAARGRKTVFSVLADGKAIAGGQVNFATLLVTPEGGRVVRRQLVEAQQGESQQEEMVFEETGRLLKISYLQSGGWSEASTAKEVAEIFPNARQYQQRETTAPATPENPDMPSDESEPPDRPDTAPDAAGRDEL